MKEVPFYMVFVMYLIISNNHLAQLFSCQTQYMLNKSMFVKHIVGYMTLLFFVVLSGGNNNNHHSAPTALLYSLLIYIVFWFSTRISFEYFIVFIILTALLYIIHLFQNDNDDNVINMRLQITKDILQVSIFVVLIIGFIFYYIEKKLEYKKKFSITKFILGKPTCKTINKSVLSKK